MRLSTVLLGLSLAFSVGCGKEGDKKTTDKTPGDDDSKLPRVLTMTEAMATLRAEMQAAAFKQEGAGFSDVRALACDQSTEGGFSDCLSPMNRFLEKELVAPKDFLKFDNNGPNVYQNFEDKLFLTCLMAVGLESVAEKSADGYFKNGRYDFSTENMDLTQVVQSCGSTPETIQFMIGNVPVAFDVEVSDAGKTQFDKKLIVEVSDANSTHIDILARHKEDLGINFAIRHRYKNKDDFGGTDYNALDRSIIQYSLTQDTLRYEFVAPKPMKTGGSGNAAGTTLRLFSEGTADQVYILADYDFSVDLTYTITAKPKNGADIALSVWGGYMNDFNFTSVKFGCLAKNLTGVTAGKDGSLSCTLPGVKANNTQLANIVNGVRQLTLTADNITSELLPVDPVVSLQFGAQDTFVVEFQK